jgi:hypothetical protein
MDADGDGKITEKEFTGPKAVFSRLDRDGDGVISRDELPPFGRRPGATRPGAESRPRRDAQANPNRPKEEAKPAKESKEEAKPAKESKKEAKPEKESKDAS